MDDLDKLDSYLSSEDNSENRMLLSELDGFLHGVACTPVPIDEWLEIACGDAADIPDTILSIVSSRLKEIRTRLDTQSGLAEPIFWQAKEGHAIAMGWCEGFMEAVKCRHETWDKFTSTANGSKMMMPILVHLLDENGNSLFNIPQEELDETLDAASEAIPSILPAIYQEIRGLKLN